MATDIDIDIPGRPELLYDASPPFIDKNAGWCMAAAGFLLFVLFRESAFLWGIPAGLLLQYSRHHLYSRPPGKIVFPDKLFDCGDYLLVETNGMTTKVPFSDIDDISCVTGEIEVNNDGFDLLAATTTLRLRKPTELFTEIKCRQHMGFARRASMDDYHRPPPLFVKLQHRLGEHRGTPCAQ
jgi:hypothetical protein